MNKKEFTHNKDNSREIAKVRTNGHVLKRWPFEMRASTPNEKKKFVSQQCFTFDDESIINKDTSNLGKENLFKGKSLEFTDSDSTNNNNNNNNTSAINQNNTSNSTNNIINSMTSSNFYSARERFSKTASMNRSILISSTIAEIGDSTINFSPINESSFNFSSLTTSKSEKNTTITNSLNARTTMTTTMSNKLKTVISTPSTSSVATAKIESNQFIKIALESCQLIKDYNDMLVEVAVDASVCGGKVDGSYIDFTKLDDEFNQLTNNLTNEDLKSVDMDICSLCAMTDVNANNNNTMDMFLII